jgi:hypothetical protein
MNTTNAQETPTEAFRRLVVRYAPLFIATKDFYDHLNARSVSNHGHGFDHDLMVAQYCVLIAESPRVGELGWVAGLLHSIDRHFGDQGAGDSEIIRRLDLLPKEMLTMLERFAIIEAIKSHSRENADCDGPVTIVLKDADRLANIGALNLVRSGQHRPHIPAAILETLGGLHPESTFQEPKCCYDATIYNNEWEAMLRLPKARELGRLEFEYTAEWRRRVEAKFAQVGLYPYPFAGK